MFDVTPEPKRTNEARALPQRGGAAADHVRALSQGWSGLKTYSAIELQAAVGNKAVSRVLSSRAPEPMVLRQAAGAPAQTSSKSPQKMTDDELWEEYQDLSGTLSQPVSTTDRALREQQLSALEAEVTRRLPKPSKGSPEAAARDKLEATQYCDYFYRRTMDFLYAFDKARTTAVENYLDVGDQEDPPSLAIPILLTAVSAVFAAYGGWALVAEGIAGGAFAMNRGRLSKSLGERIGTRGRSVLANLGRSARDQNLGAAAAAALEKIAAPGDPGQDVVTTAMEIQEINAKATLATGAVEARERTLAEFGDAQARLMSEEDQVRIWIAKAGNEPMYQGILLQYVQESLGPAPQPPPEHGAALVAAAKKIELELYKTKFYGKGTLTLIPYSFMRSPGTLDAPDWSSAVEQRISELMGAPTAGANAYAAELKKWPGAKTFTSPEVLATKAIADYLGFSTAIINPPMH